MTPDTILKLVTIGGGTGVLACIVYAFMSDLVMTRKAVEKLLNVITESKDREIALITKERDDYRDMANRNSGSQQVQAQAVRDLSDAIMAAVARTDRRHP